MSLLGNIVRSNKKEAGGGAGGVASANNGLSLDTATGTIAQIGQDVGAVGNPGIMLNGREVPMGGFDFQFINGAGRKLLLDPSGVTQYILGDVDNTEGHNAHLDILGSLGFIQALLFTGAGPVFQFSMGSNGTGVFGGSDGAGNQFETKVFNNSIKTRYQQNANGEAGLLCQSDGANPQVALQALDVAPLSNFLQLQLSRDKLEVIGGVAGVSAIPLLLDLTNNIYRIGDTGPYNNGTFLQIDDTAQTVQFESAGDKYLLIDAGAGQTQIGNIDTGIHTFYDGGSAYIQTIANRYLSIKPGAGDENYKLGDLDGGGNTTVLLIDDANESFTLTSAGGNGIGGLTTNAPSATGAGLWLLGKRVAAAVAFDATQYIEVMIDGTLRKLALAA